MKAGKKQIGKKIRIALLGALSILFFASLYGLYHVYKKPVEVENSVPLYSYQHKAELKYTVQLKPNSIYQETMQGPDRTYFSKLVDYFNVYFSYNYTGDSDASIKGAYEIIAVIDAPEMWRKTFVLVPFSEMTASGNSLSINKEFPVALNQYNELLKQVNEEIGVAAREPKLNIQANVYLKAVAGDNAVKEDLTPVMSIPLTTGDFKVGGEPSVEKEGSVTKTEVIADPAAASMKVRQLYIWAASSVLLGLLLVLLLLLTGNKVIEVDERKTLIDSIRKKYGERMVMVQDKFSPNEKMTVLSFSSMEDLVKLADELNKPVLCQASASPGGYPCYYVLDGLTAYKHQLSKGGTLRAFTPPASHESRPTTYAPSE